MARLDHHANIWRDIADERDRQRSKWEKPHRWGIGDCSSAGVTEPVKAAALAEECGEVARAVLEGDSESLRTELIQVCAVALAWLEGIDR